LKDILISKKNKSSLFLELDEDNDMRKYLIGKLLNTKIWRRKIPILISVGDTTSSISSGMSIHYILIFLMNLLNLSLVHVHLTYLDGKKYRRCALTCHFTWLGITLMFLTIQSYHAQLNTYLTCIFFSI